MRLLWLATQCGQRLQLAGDRGGNLELAKQRSALRVVR